jgi:hypothetical protein
VPHARHITPVEFKVDLAELADAGTAVGRESAAIKEDLAKLGNFFHLVEGDWHSPSGESCVQLQKSFTVATADLVSLLEEMVRRMQHSYANYKHIEETNAANLKAGQHAAAGHPAAAGHHGAAGHHVAAGHHGAAGHDPAGHRDDSPRREVSEPLASRQAAVPEMAREAIATDQVDPA